MSTEIDGIARKAAKQWCDLFVKEVLTSRVSMREKFQRVFSAGFKRGLQVGEAASELAEVLPDESTNTKGGE